MIQRPLNFVAYTDGAGRKVVTFNGRPLECPAVPWRIDPGEYDWGSISAGAFDLALAICCTVLGDRALAEEVYQDYCAYLIAKITVAEWQLPTTTVLEWIEDHPKGRAMLSRN